MPKNQHYYVLLKKQQGKPSIVYITDGWANFWVKSVNLAFFSDLRKKLNLTSNLKTFVTHLRTSLEKTSSLMIQPYGISIEVSLGIGQGLVMNCSIPIQEHVSFNRHQREWQLIMKTYTYHCWQAHRSQKLQDEAKYEKSKVQIQKKSLLEKQDKLFSSLENRKNEADVKTKMIKKNTSLINPNRRKNKGRGAKIGGEEVE